MTDETKKQLMSELGRLGGRARTAALTPKERQESARQAGLASGKARAKK